MNNAVITPEHSKQARESLNISQSKAAQGAGINRAYLSQFESGTRILDDNSLDELLLFYVEQGWEQPEEAPIEYEVALSSGTYKACDGFLLPAQSDKEDVERLLDLYHENADKIAQQQALKAPRGFFGGLDELGSQEESQIMLELMATNYLIIRKLHGQNALTPIVLDSENIKTLGDFVRSKLQLGLVGIMGEGQENQEV